MMLKLKFLILAVTIFSVFSYGVFIGSQQIFPFEQLSHLKSIIFKETNNTFFEVYETHDSFLKRIDLDSKSDIEDKRNNLIEFIWNQNQLPTNNPNIVKDYNKMENFSEYNNLQNIQQFTTMMNLEESSSIRLDSPITSVSYFFKNQESNNELIIFHQGHSEKSIHDSKKIINFFLEQNYDVIVFSMIMKNENSQPIADIPDLGKIKLTSHNLFYLFDETSIPMKFYFEPITFSLNYLEKLYEYKKIHLIGISGGGWTSVIYPTLDDRISDSFSIAGALPIFLREPKMDLGDFEQNFDDFYSILSYEEFFVTSSFESNKKLIQFFIFNDPCCFPAERYELFPYEKLINDKINSLGGEGRFSVILDNSTIKHEISDFILENIMNEIKQ